MSDEQLNSMDRDYSQYGPGGRTNAEIWKDQCERMDADRLHQSAARKSSARYQTDYTPEVPDSAKFASSCVFLIAGCLALGYASTLRGDSRPLIAVMALTAIVLSLFSLAGLLLRSLLRRVGPLLKPLIVAAIICGICYLCASAKR